MKRLAALVALATACAPIRPEPTTACRIVRDTKLGGSSIKDLWEVSLGTPIEPLAQSAYAQQITAFTAGGLGAAGLAAGFIMGFATDAATHPEVRNAGYGIVGGAGGLIIMTLTLTYTTRRTAEAARIRLRAYADRCGP